MAIDLNKLERDVADPQPDAPAEVTRFPRIATPSTLAELRRLMDDLETYNRQALKVARDAITRMVG